MMRESDQQEMGRKWAETCGCLGSRPSASQLSPRGKSRAESARSLSAGDGVEHLVRPRRVGPRRCSAGEGNDTPGEKPEVWGPPPALCTAVVSARATGWEVNHPKGVEGTVATTVTR